MTRSNRPALSADRANDLLIYDPDTGSLNWHVTRPGAPAGALVGTRTSEGYTQVEIDYRLYKAHRVIWLMRTGRWPKHHIDHKNGMRADNRWQNLREATPLQNARNRRPLKDSGSGRVGVCFDTKRSKWSAYIGIDNRTVSLGFFENLDDAIDARGAAERKHFGEFAAEYSRFEKATCRRASGGSAR